MRALARSTLALLVSAIAGCNAITGLDADYVEGSTPSGAAGSAGTPGSGGASTTAGSGGSTAGHGGATGGSSGVGGATAGFAGSAGAKAGGAGTGGVGGVGGVGGSSGHAGTSGAPAGGKGGASGIGGKAGASGKSGAAGASGAGNGGTGGCTCSLANATSACDASGACAITSCDAGHADCDHVTANGCEATLATDASNCGACGTTCATTHGSAFCVNGACQIACDPGYTTCSGGCVDVTSDAANCGACGSACSAAHGTPSCAASTCSIACDPGFGDCDGDVSNGCETDVTQDAANCGACGSACSAVHGTPSCTASACSIACDPGFADCDGDASNGCETDLTTISNCGACGHACSPSIGGTTSCVAGVCMVSLCKGETKCTAANGDQSCANLNSDPLNCGSCGHVCGTQNTTSATCVVPCSTCCTDTCSCDPNCASCCGPYTCCSPPTCSFQCKTGFADCDNVDANGCEASLATDPQHCGGCNHVCAADEECIASTCSRVLSKGPDAQHACAVASDGTLWCWGANGSGQLGDGTTTPRATPVQVSTSNGPLKPVVAVATGAAHTCATVAGNGVWCWGANDSGQLGIGTVSATPQLVPTKVPNIANSDGVAIGAGIAHTCIVRSGIGGIRCWGANASGQLGTGNTTPRSSPIDAQFPKNATGVTLALGGNHTCAISKGTLYCTGSNDHGQIGNGAPGDALSFVPIMLPAPAALVTAGTFHTCARTTAGDLLCWGDASHGQIGTGATTGISAVPLIIAGIDPAGDMAGGHGHGCAGLASNAVACWGDATSGELALGTTVGTANCLAPNDCDPTPQTTKLTDVVELSSGVRFSCARKTDGTIWCWGEGGSGQLGNGATASSSVPVQVVGIP